MYKAGFEYDYDLNNNVAKLTASTLYGTSSVTYSYGNDNLLTKTVLPNSKQQNYTHDGLGRLTGTSLNTMNSIQKQYTYLASTYVDDYPNSNAAYTTNLIGTETIGTYEYQYEYDAAGNITQISRKPNGGTEPSTVATYTYDYMGQLAQVDDIENEMRYKYTYTSGGNIDKEKTYELINGNATLISINRYTYGNNNWKDLLTAYKGQGINYDSIGNPIQYRDGITFSWSNGRQLTNYSQGTNNVSYTYDSSGMRLSKTVTKNNSEIDYTYLYNNGKLMQETQGDRILDYYYDANGQAIALKYRTSANATGVYYYYAYNWRGDIVGLYNADGSLYCTYSYDAWGNILSVKDSIGVTIDKDDEDIANYQSLRYRGYVYDTETGLYYLQSRYYDPVTHRFINADALISTGTGVLGYNMFAYCDNSPVNGCDPSGLARNTTDDFNNNGIADYLEERWIELTNRWRAILDGSECRDVTNEVNTALEHEVKIDSFWNFRGLLVRLDEFIRKVDHEAPWDIKLKDSWNKTISDNYPGDFSTIVIYEGHYYTPEILGNYTYGAIGKAYDFSLPLLFAGSLIAAHFPEVDTVKYSNEMSDWLFIANGYYKYN